MDFEVINVANKVELLSAIAENQNNDFRFGAGYTDLINQFNHQPTEGLIVINITDLDEPSFNSIKEEEENIVIGALVTASCLVNSELIEKQFPVLHQAAASVASIQIRNSATVGGNICNASPAGDMSAALVALQANCIVLNSDGAERTEPLASFIQGVGKTSLDKNEILHQITIPVNNHNNLISGFAKVGTRNSMEISIVSLSYHIQLKNDGTIVDAGVSCGAVAPIIPFAQSACDFISGKDVSVLTDSDKKEFAKMVLEYAIPISDIRASDWYRKEVLFNLSQTIFN